MKTIFESLSQRKTCWRQHCLAVPHFSNSQLLIIPIQWKVKKQIKSPSPLVWKWSCLLLPEENTEWRDCRLWAPLNCSRNCLPGLMKSCPPTNQSVVLPGSHQTADLVDRKCTCCKPNRATIRLVRIIKYQIFGYPSSYRNQPSTDPSCDPD